MKTSVGLSFHHLSSQIRAAAVLRVCARACVCVTCCVFSGAASPISFFKELYLTSSGRFTCVTSVSVRERQVCAAGS